MFRSAVRYLSSSSSASAAAASATGAGAGAGAGSGAAPVTVPITTAAKQLRPLDMSRSKRKNIIKKEQRMKRQIIRDVNNAKKWNFVM